MIYTEKLLETVCCEPICSCCFLSQNFKPEDQTFLTLKKKKSMCLPKRNIVSFHQELFSDESIVCVWLVNTQKVELGQRVYACSFCLGLVSPMISNIFLLRPLLSFIFLTGNILCFWFYLLHSFVHG